MKNLKKLLMKNLGFSRCMKNLENVSNHDLFLDFGTPNSGHMRFHSTMPKMN